jgi:hypothetical protein
MAAINGTDSVVLRLCFPFISAASKAAKLNPEVCYRRETCDGCTFNETATSNVPLRAMTNGSGSVQTKRDET